jgi:hypothetical protein
MTKSEERVLTIYEEWKDRADAIGIYPAVKELAVALERAELRYEELMQKIREVK